MPLALAGEQMNFFVRGAKTFALGSTIQMLDFDGVAREGGGGRCGVKHLQSS